MLATGSLMARAVGLVLLPIFTRLYSPADFGVMAVFSALVFMLMPAMTLRYVLAVPLPRHDGLALNILVLSLALMALSGLVVAIMLVAFGAPLLLLLGMKSIAAWWWLVVLALFGGGAYEGLMLWATRKRAYKAIARTQVTKSLAEAGTKLGFGLTTPGPLGLIVGQVVAQSGGIGALLRQFGGELRANWRHVRVSRLRKVAWRYRAFPIFRLPSQFLMVFSQQAPLIFAAGLFGEVTAGQLALALTVTAVPLALLGGSMGTALYGEAARIGIHEPHRLLRLVKTTQKRLVLIAIGPAAVLCLFGSPLFVLIFGQAWATAGQFASILSVYLLFQFTSAPMMQMMNLIDAQQMFLAINMVRAVLTLGLVFATASMDASALHFVSSYSVMMTVVYFAISIWLLIKLSALSRTNPDASVRGI